MTDSSDNCSFWTSRGARTGEANQGVRLDSYSIISFNDEAQVGSRDTHHLLSASLSFAQVILENDFASAPDQLLAAALKHRPEGGANSTGAINLAQTVMERCWSTDK